MAEDTRSGASLPPSAAVALLTLKLRAALQEADAAEAAVEAIDVDRARADLRVQLDTITTERRAALDAELEAERNTAAASLEAARAEAEGIVAEAQRHAAELAKLKPAEPVITTEVPAVPTVPIVPTAPIVPAAEHLGSDDIALPSEVEPEFEAEFEAVPVIEPEPDAELVAAVETAFSSAITTYEGTSAWAPVPVVGSQVASGPTVSIDAEAFARVFATVLATVLDERFTAWRTAMPGTAFAQPALVVPPPQKKSLVRRLFHLDTVLMVLAAAIVIVLLFAWMG